jgi:hypothetical protein
MKILHPEPASAAESPSTPMKRFNGRLKLKSRRAVSTLKVI